MLSEKSLCKSCRFCVLHESCVIFFFLDRKNGAWLSGVTFPLGKPPGAGIVWPSILEHFVLMVIF